jgi:tyrosine phenol-lyase
VEQKCALDLLLRDDIKLVTLIGPAGTGKTLLALAAGLKKVFDDNVYTKILVSRPIMPLGKDIGYLPGTKEEKLYHWMQPIYDNLEFLCDSTGSEASETLKWVMESKRIEMEAVTYIRGRSLPKMYIIIDEAHDSTNLHPFKGNIDLDKVQALIDKVGADNIAYVSVAGTVNMAGGQPVSMANIKALRALCDKHSIKVYLDATRMMENAYFIQEREEGYANKSIAEILKEFCSYTDAAWMSAKKDNLVNIGGWLAVNDWTLFEEIRNLVVVYEGLHTYGGLAGRDLEALAIGIEESVKDQHIRSRIGQVLYLGELLTDWGIPIVQPVGGHAIFLDAKAFYPHLKQIEFPAQTLAAELYLDSGIRSMERGIVSAGRNAKTGDHYYPKLELTRLTIPRRVYTQAHMDVVAEAVKAVYDARETTRGLKMVYEPKYLRFFQARFERL